MKKTNLYQVANAHIWLQSRRIEIAHQKEERDEEEREEKDDNKQNNGKHRKRKPRLAW